MDSGSRVRDKYSGSATLLYMNAAIVDRFADRLLSIGYGTVCTVLTYIIITDTTHLRVVWSLQIIVTLYDSVKTKS